MPRSRIVLFAIILFASIGAKAQQYQIDGTISIDSFYNNFLTNQSPKHELFSFESHLDGCKWYLRVVNRKASVFDYQETSWDGTNLYYLMSVKGAVEEARRNGKKVGANEAIASTSKSEIPHNSFFEFAGPIWLTYFSGCYFKAALPNARIEPVISRTGSGVIYDNYNLMPQKARWSLYDVPPYLPSKVFYFDDGSVPVGRGEYIARREKRDPPFATGFIDTVFSTINTTNCGGLLLPTRSVLETFGPKRDAKSNDELLLWQRFEITLLRASTSSSVALFQPKISGVTPVLDERFMNVAGKLQYMVTNGWVSEGVIIGSKLYKQGVQIEGIHVVGKVRPLWIWLILVLIFLLPIGAIGLNKLNHKKNLERKEH